MPGAAAAAGGAAGDLVPLPCASWKRNERGLVVIERPAPSSQGWRRLRDWLVYWMATPRLRLDEVGTSTWLLLDGTRSMAEICSALQERYPDREQLPKRLGIFLHHLYKQGFLSFR